MQKSSTGDNNFVKWKGIPRLRGYTLYYFLELFCLFMIELFLSKSNFDDDFSAKIEVNEWKKKQTWQPRAITRELKSQIWADGEHETANGNPPFCRLR